MLLIRKSLLCKSMVQNLLNTVYNYSLSYNKGGILKNVQDAWNHLGAKGIPDDLGTNCWGGRWEILCC